MCIPVVRRQEISEAMVMKTFKLLCPSRDAVSKGASLLILFFSGTNSYNVTRLRTATSYSEKLGGLPISESEVTVFFRRSVVKKPIQLVSSSGQREPGRSKTGRTREEGRGVKGIPRRGGVVTPKPTAYAARPPV